jgi:hypothetical protein
MGRSAPEVAESNILARCILGVLFVEISKMNSLPACTYNSIHE